MGKIEMICIICPRGCRLKVTKDESLDGGYKVSGAACKRGKSYAIKEITSPTRLLTSTVKITGAELPRLPVRTNREIGKEKILECMKLINTIESQAPVYMGDVLLRDVLASGVDIIASRDMIKR